MAISSGLALAGGALLGSGLLGGGSKQKGSTNTTQTNTPWSGVQEPLLDLFSRGRSALDSSSSGFSPLASNQARGALGGLLNPNFVSLNPQSNQAFQNAVNDALGLAKSQFAGQYGGQAGSNLGNSGYQEALARGLGSAATNAYADQYNRNLDYNKGLMGLQLGALSAAPSLDASAMAADQYSSPFTNLARYGDLLRLGTGYGTSSVQQPYFTNPAAGALGGALAAGQIYKMF